MRTTLDESKDDLIDRAAKLADVPGGEGPPGTTSTQFLRTYFRHVAPEDLLSRSEADLYGAAMSHFDLARSRPQGTANVRALTPNESEQGWRASGHTVVEVVTDDMPFLVDSVTMALGAQGRSVHVVVHPQLLVRRDLTGALLEVHTSEAHDGPAHDGAHDVFRESWMHVEVDRETSPEELAEIERALGKVLRDVREAVEDWGRMRSQAERVVAELEESPPPLPADEIAEGEALLRWLADDHFTFLGYREYRLHREDGHDVLRAVPGTGFGILRADQDMSHSFGRLPPLVAAKAREKTLLVLTKANSKATVHRPVHLDYVGVKSFDESGEVVGERLSLIHI